MTESEARQLLALFLFAFKSYRKLLFQKFPRGSKQRELAQTLQPWILGDEGDRIKETLERLRAAPTLAPLDFNNICLLANMHLNPVQEILIEAGQRPLPYPDTKQIQLRVWAPEKQTLAGAARLLLPSKARKQTKQGGKNKKATKSKKP